MNTLTLKKLLDQIQKAELSFQTQNRLQSLGSAFSQIVSQPQNPQFQNNLSDALGEFRLALSRFQEQFSPREYERVLDLAESAFAADLADVISQEIEANPITPNVVNETVQKIISQREEVFENINSLSEAMEFFDNGEEGNDTGLVELGFQIPRDFFENNLDGLIDELTELKRIIRFFSEATIGKNAEAIVGSISTSDPLIFLGIVEPVAIKLGAAVTWAIGVWYSVEKIRNLRAQTAQLSSFDEDEVEAIFGDKIKTEVSSQVDEKVEELISSGDALEVNKGELKGQLTWALNSLLSKIERGMTVELRIRSQVEEDGVEEDEDKANAKVADEQLFEIQKNLIFKKPGDEPVLQIPKFREE